MAIYINIFLMFLRDVIYVYIIINAMFFIMFYGIMSLSKAGVCWLF